MVTTLSCRCGALQLEVDGAPIVSTECCCDSCRAAGVRIEALAGAPDVVNAFGATRFVLYRKDRARVLSGAQHLREFRLTDTSPTRRVVAACCNTPVFLEFKGGHWLSIYGAMWTEGRLPPLQMRTMTADLPDRSVLPADVPNLKGQSAGFFARLLGAWIAMGFRSPRVEVAGRLEA